MTLPLTRTTFSTGFAAPAVGSVKGGGVATRARPFSLPRHGGVSAPAVGGRRATLDRADTHRSPLGIDVKEKPPVADTAAKGGRLIVETLNVTRERVGCHVRQRGLEPFPLGSRSARDDFSRAALDEDRPGRGRAHGS